MRHVADSPRTSALVTPLVADPRSDGVLVLRPGALGDTLLAVPALRALRRAVGPLTLAGHAGAARLLAGLGEVDGWLAFDDPALAWLFGAPSEAHRRVVGWLDAAAAPGLAEALLVAPSRPPENRPQHVAEYLLQTLTPLGIELDFNTRPLGVTAIESDEILVHSGSGSAAKNWPATQFAETIRALDGPVGLIVGEADRAAASEVEAALGCRLPRLESAAGTARTTSGWLPRLRWQRFRRQPPRRPVRCTKRRPVRSNIAPPLAPTRPESPSPALRRFATAGRRITSVDGEQLHISGG